MKIEDGNIIPNIGVGKYLLNMTRQELTCIIGKDYKERVRVKNTIISVENAKFWIANDGRVDQIGVSKGFHGTYKNLIGIGSTLGEIREKIGNYVEVGDTYEMEFERGICFELADVEDWEELRAPIESIYVYRMTD